MRMRALLAGGNDKEAVECFAKHYEHYQHVAEDHQVHHACRMLIARFCLSLWYQTLPPGPLLWLNVTFALTYSTRPEFFVCELMI